MPLATITLLLYTTITTFVKYPLLKFLWYNLRYANYHNIYENKGVFY
jgi:hypothetical protein